jgi:hypothetical protein
MGRRGGIYLESKALVLWIQGRPQEKYLNIALNASADWGPIRAQRPEFQFSQMKTLSFRKISTPCL